MPSGGVHSITLAPGDIVIMDNLATHKVAGVRQAIEAAGAVLLYLPPHSPISIRSNSSSPSSKHYCVKPPNEPSRRYGALWAAIGRLLDDLPADECSHYLAHAGYGSI